MQTRSTNENMKIVTLRLGQVNSDSRFPEPRSPCRLTDLASPGSPEFVDQTVPLRVYVHVHIHVDV